MRTNFFYNTINQIGKALKKSNKKAKSQQDTIKALFVQNPHLEITPFEVKKMVKLKGVPITSIRRCLSNLTNEGHLTKTSTQKIGEYGAKNYCWKLK